MKPRKEHCVDLGLGLVVWQDACVYFRQHTLEQYKTLRQISIGQVNYDRKRRVFIVIHNYRQDQVDHDGTVIPDMWLLSFTPLAPDKKRVKELKRLAPWQGGAK